jgi:hypothetical protein
MNEAAQRDGRRLTELLTQQRDAYRRLRDLATTQRGAIESDQTETLLRILGDRQRAITELTGINAELEPFRSRWDQTRQTMEPMARLEVSDLVAEVQQLLAAILDQDEGDCDVLKQRTADARRSATVAAVGQQINSAYGGAGYGATQPKYVDRTDEGR